MRYRTHTQSSGSWTTYWFEKNMLGDIVAVYNSSGTKILSYKYDAWGNFVSIPHATDSVGGVAKNPFRYRGYYYDVDLKLYVTGTRCYDPAIGRFINADGYVSTGQGLLGNNMYAYCNNNPIMYVDYSGDFPVLLTVILVTSTVIGGVLGFLSHEKLAGNAKRDPDESSTNTPPKSLEEYDKQITNENDEGKTELTVGDRIANTVIGASVGLMTGGMIAVTGGLVVGLTKSIVIGKCYFAAGSLATMVGSSILSGFCITIDPVEYEPSTTIDPTPPPDYDNGPWNK